MTIRTGPASACGPSPRPSVAAPPATIRRLPLDRGPLDRSTGRRARDDGRALERPGVPATHVPDEDEGPREPTEAFDPYEAEREVQWPIDLRDVIEPEFDEDEGSARA